MQNDGGAAGAERGCGGQHVGGHCVAPPTAAAGHGLNAAVCGCVAVLSCPTLP